MTDLKTSARAFDKALAALKAATDDYFKACIAVGRAAGDPTARGLDVKQVRQRLQAEVIARLSPRPVHGVPASTLQFDGAPEARRFVASRPLPGLK